MRFVVPKFIEHEPKIVGPLTFRQFIYIGMAAGVCFLLYFSLAKKNFLLFLALAIILMVGALAFAFLKIGGRPLPTIFGNFLGFFISPKIYIWKKTEAVVEVFKKMEIKKEEKKEELPLKMAEGSQLKKLRTQIETKTK